MHSSVLIMERCGATLKLQSMPIDIVKQAAGAVSYADCFVWIELWNADDECRMFAEFKPEFDDPNQERMTISLSMLYAALSAPIDEGHAVRYEHVAIAVQHAAESETPLIRADAIRQRICRARPILEANLKPSELRLFFQDPGRQVEDN